MFRTPRCILIFVFVLALFVSAQAQKTDGAKPNPEADIKHGAVLCVWLIYREVKTIGDTCFPGQNAGFQAALDRAIGRIDDFIIVNTPMSRAKLEEAKRSGANMAPTEKLCKDVGSQLYGMIKAQGVDGVDQAVSNLLSVPRQPAMSPCL